MVEPMMKDKRHIIQRKAYGRVLSVLLLLGIMFGLTQYSHLRSDWTKDQVYSLSESTRHVLQGLDEPVMIRAYMTSDMPQPYGRLQQFVEDMLMAYQEAGNGRLSYALVDPASDDNVAAALTALKVPKVQVQVVEDDRAQVKQGYLAVVVEYLDRKETIPVVQSVDAFEYLLTRKIKKVTGKGRGKLGIVTDFGAHGLSALQQFASLVQDDYELVDVSLREQPVDDDIQGLIVAGMMQAPSEAWRFHLDQFRMRGGGVWVLAGNARPELRQGFNVLPVESDANDWLRSDLKVAIEPGLVMDQRAQRVSVQNGMFRSQVDYPFVPNILDLNEHHTITKALEAVSVPFPSPLAVMNDDAQILMQSSISSAVQNGPPFDVYPLMSVEQRFAGLQMRSEVLGALQEGAMDSAFVEIPQDIHVDALQSHTDAGRWMVVASPAMLDNEFMSGSSLVLALNAVDWLVKDEALIALRSRGVTERPLAELSYEGRMFFKALWLFGLPFLILSLGLWRWWRIKHQAVQSHE